MAQKKAVILRVDPQLWKELNAWAQDELRSLNGQVEYILREAVKKRTGESKK
ncbi:MAG: DNA-binding protein [Melioribacteraceae bacterium]